MELPLQQHPTFGAALRRLGRDVLVSDLHGAAPLQIIRRCGVTLAARGPIWGQKPDLDALRASGPLIINSDDKNDLRKAGYRLIMTSASVAEYDLRHTPPPHAKWRANLRKAKSADLKVRTGPFGKNHEWLLDADLAQQRAKRYRALPHAIIHAYAAESPRDVIVVTALKQKDVIAAMLFLCHHPVATYHIGWSNADGRQTCAHALLLNRAAKHLASAGFTRLDLGHVDTENTPGLARFKIGSGAAVRQLGGTWLRCPI